MSRTFDRAESRRQHGLRISTDSVVRPRIARRRCTTVSRPWTLRRTLVAALVRK